MDPFELSYSDQEHDDSCSVENDTQTEQSNKKSASEVIPANQSPSLGSSGSDGRDPFVRKCDILILGDRNAGKKTFMQQFNF